MKFYIASRLENYEQVQILAGKLKAAGWTHTYDWAAEWLSHGRANPTNAEALKAIGEDAVKGVSNADAVIVLTPQGKGTHTELGIAIALNKKIFLCHPDGTYFKCDGNTCPFYHLPQVTQLTGNTEEIAEAVLRFGSKQ